MITSITISPHITHSIDHSWRYEIQLLVGFFSYRLAPSPIRITVLSDNEVYTLSWYKRQAERFFSHAHCNVIILFKYTLTIIVGNNII